MGVTCKTACITYAAPWNKTAQNLCQARKSCACKCRTLLAAYPALVEGCEAGCHSDSNSLKDIDSAETFICKNPQDAFNKFGIVCKDFDPLKQTVQGLDIQQAEKAAKQNTKYLWWGAAVVGVLIIIYLFK
jgi:hypothetical protein